jgi:hypothetical protein
MNGVKVSALSVMVMVMAQVSVSACDGGDD